MLSTAIIFEVSVLTLTKVQTAKINDTFFMTKLQKPYLDLWLVGKYIIAIRIKIILQDMPSLE